MNPTRIMAEATLNGTDREPVIRGLATSPDGHGGWRNTSASTPGGSALDDNPDAMVVLRSNDASRVEPRENAAEDETQDTVPQHVHNRSEPMQSSVVVLPPKLREPPYGFRLLQQWEGTVTSVTEQEFTAELWDLTDERNAREEAAFEIEEVPPGDLSLLTQGAAFRWSIGYRTWPDGQRECVSHLRFVRLPAWGRATVKAVEEQAVELQARFGLDAND